MKLKRKLGFLEVFCIASGAMISSGLFVLPGQAFQQAGPGVILAYAMAGLLMIPAMFSQAELATAMPRSGGSYFFIERSMGGLPGTLAGLAEWLSITFKASFALIGIGTFTRLIWPDVSDWVIKVIAIGSCLFFTSLNLLSVKGTGKAQIAMVAVLLAVLVAFLVFGLPAVEHSRYAGFMDKGLGTVFATAGLVFVAYGGLTKVASVGEEIKHPGRVIPAGMFAASIIVSILYVVAVFVTVGTVDAGQLSGSLTPLSHAARGTAMGSAGVVVLAVAAMLAFLTTANSGVLAASRSPMAMSRDGLMPPLLQKVSARMGTPYVSILLTAGVMVLIIAALSIQDLVKVASTMMLMLFVLVNLSVLVMRSSRIQNYRPLFRTPAYPLFQIVGIVAYAFLIIEMGRTALLTTSVFLLLGAMWYVIYVRKRVSRESALVYMVRKVVSKEIYRADLEEELKQIAMERDQVTHDRFDHLVSRCEILDLPGPVEPEEMFRLAAVAMGPRLNIDSEKLLDLFKAREAQSSTVVQPGLAIPHVIVPGEGLFDIALVRCKEGVSYPNQPEPVRMAFVLVGSSDQRNYHLRALMAVAHVVSEHKFADRWLKAPAGEHLRDLVLLSKRQRDESQQGRAP